MKRFFALLCAAFLLSACSASGTAAPPGEASSVEAAEPPTPIVPRPTTHVPRSKPDEGETWPERLKSHLPPGWTWREFDGPVLVLHDRKVPERWIRELGRTLAVLLRDEFAQRLPTARPFEDVFLFRVCKDRVQYEMYGGSPGTDGYWNDADREAVGFYEYSGRRDSFRAFQGLAFLQYLHKAGAGSAHPWFAHGLAECYSGYSVNDNGNILPKPRFRWKATRIDDSSGRGPIPIRTLVSLTHEEFYGPWIHENFAQAWSFVWFLRQTRNPAWNGILDRYYLALRDRISAGTAGRSEEGPGRSPVVPAEVAEKARAAALEAAFGELDDAAWDEMTEEWRRFR